MEDGLARRETGDPLVDWGLSRAHQGVCEEWARRAFSGISI